VAISKAPLQVHYYSEALPRTRFEPFGRKAMILPISHHTPQFL